ncbi:MAG: hypothetical protein U9Q34_03755 [Elusimicrobiota bacterium]|nr:hypothetical protein [Elusimicrobiota bacterium]
MNKGKMIGGQIFFGLVVIAGFIVLGSMQLNRDRRSDRDLLNKVQMAVMTEYFPNEVDNIKKAGSDSVRAGSIKLDIKEINVSYPVYTRSTRYKTGVLKVAFTLSDADKIIKDGITFYSFSHSPISDNWRIKGRSNKNYYYMSLVF